MRKFISVITTFILVASVFSASVSADRVIEITAYGKMAKAPVITVTLPKTMTFVFNPYEMKVTGKETVYKIGSKASKILCNYTSADGNSWVITNESEVAIKAGVYAYTYQSNGAFSVRDANINTVDPSDETCKYLLLDIKASGGSTGTQSITLLNQWLRTDEGDNSRALIRTSADAPDWWSEENEGIVTVIRNVQKNGEINITMSGDTQNTGDLPWKKSDKAIVYFVFGFDPEPPTGS